ncbi:hypothetical protein [Caryophanon latum]|uniref:DUF3139 domain-containing protein n=1 Tax=Caryophanon latum TaxID=33977 RepID=A0A1C0Y5I9_9BACL|nr:hypothetical protein [Caryophanon latum]OCS82442.1 hypothetical protein A6K76_16300 [Caryophanon latum]
MLKKILLLLICTTVITVSAISLMRYLLVNEVENHLIEEGFDKDQFDTSYYRNISLKGNDSKQVKVIFTSQPDYHFYFYKNDDATIELRTIKDLTTNTRLGTAEEMAPYISKIQAK